MEQIVPQKRTYVESTYQLRSNDPAVVKPTINKYQPYISYKAADFAEFNPVKQTVEKGGREYLAADDIPFSKRGFQYNPCVPNPMLSVIKFSTRDIYPFRSSLNMFDRSASTFISKDQCSLTTDQGWCSARGNVAITEGCVYFEFNILESDHSKHVRIGIGRREFSVEAPIGFDGYGYGLRDITGQTLHLSRPKDFMNEGFKKGDVIGIMVKLPDMGFNDVIRDQIAIRYKNHLYFEKFDYVASKEMDHLLNPVTVFGEKAVKDENKYNPDILEDSKMLVYKNGEYAGELKDLYDFKNSALRNKLVQDNGTWGYYPVASVFKGGAVELNSGPDFKYTQVMKQNGAKGLHQLYEERVADDIVWDLVDELEAETLSIK